ncbi:hypothetical protein KP509_34G018800 [Ceratopteris richardii]|uniref:Exosome complex exonuclease RRP44 homolog A n=1 Tax=Ceratopteris richardii TaxID=49495 RepID=A0A8T2QJ80_CERRI|nr:hypothetical protein KP509_34G018800 [Ceratopteris richardii]
MLQSKAFMKKTRRGQVVKVVREHYLRDDISCGAIFCQSCEKESACLSSSAPNILIVDTNVTLHHIDLLENNAIDDVVILSVVLEEVKNRNLSVYNRIRALCSNPMRRFFVFANEHHKDTFVKTMPGESPNDRNDRAIRSASLWYQKHLGQGPPILLLTNDIENKRKALQEGICTETVQSYVESLGRPELFDLVAQVCDSSLAEMDIEDSRPSKKKLIYPEHRPMSEITSGLQQRIFHQGKLRVNRYNPIEAYVNSESIDEEIIIYGRINMNRAFEGDVVAVELLPEDQWKEGNTLKLIEDEEDEVEEKVGLAPDSVDAAPTSLQAKPGDFGSKIGSRTCGRVVGIIKRNWHSYCGSLEPMPMPAGVGGAVNALFVASDRRIPKIRIQTRQLGNLLDKRILVAVDSWDISLRYPLGHYVKTIGDIGDRATESEVLMIENDINNRPFSEQVLACLPPLPWSVSQDDLKCNYREDIRHIRVFSVDPPGMYQIREANQMIEEFMLAANISVAEKILKHYPLCALLRRHPIPTPKMLEPLIRTAAAVGVKLDITSSKSLADSLDNALGNNDPYFNKLIRILATRCMTQAVYFSSGELTPPEYYHYGLAAALYTHFTSPIRRYADVIVHRLLAAALGLFKLPAVFHDKVQLNSLADNLNFRHRNAQMASRASVELHTLIYFRNRPTDAEARIVKIRSNGFIVFVPKFGIEGPVYLTPKAKDNNGEESCKNSADWIVDEEQQRISTRDGKRVYMVLDVVHVHIEVIEPQPNRSKLVLTLLK